MNYRIRLTTLIFSLTVFLSAFLLFFVQPMVGEMILPSLGGSSSVWSSTMLFFQMILLAGYIYAHGLTKYFSVSYQISIHLLLVVTSFFLLPLSVNEYWLTLLDYKALSVLLSLGIGIGLPAFIVSSSAPLYQYWFGVLDHPHSDDPYFLYAASNAGSMLALLSYPFLIDRYYNLGYQSFGWSIGFILLVILSLFCIQNLFNQNYETREPDKVRSELGDIAWSRRLWWILLTFIPSSLMLGVTHYITTDLASVPLLWVLPLAAYLLSYILVFSNLRISLIFYRVALPGIILLLFAVTFAGKLPFSLMLLLHLLTFFLIALYFHGELAHDRPNKTHLTEFYIYVALGGSLGGLFNALIAPIIFDSLVEYYLIMGIAVASVRFVNTSNRSQNRFLSWSANIITWGAVLYLLLNIDQPNWFHFQWSILIIITASSMLMFYLIWKMPRLLYVGAASIFLSGYAINEQGENVIAQERSFYGHYQVKEFDELGRSLLSGTTEHGFQKIRNGDLVTEATSYYHPSGPVGDVMAEYDYDRVGIGGLGSGALSTYADPGDKFHFFEIDPTVYNLAKQYFTYLDECQYQCEVHIGDARKLIEGYSYNFFDILIMDAYSSDSIPTHLLTKEAIQIYLSRVSRDGIVVLHLSNRYLELEHVVGAIANDLDIASNTRVYEPPIEFLHANSAVYVVLARNEEAIKELSSKDAWRPTFVGDFLWTDSYTNIVSVFMEKYDNNLDLTDIIPFKEL